MCLINKAQELPCYTHWLSAVEDRVHVDFVVDIVALGQSINMKKNKEKNSVALVRERTIPTERLPLAGEVNANFYG
jgi:hypothetical protein